MDERTASDRKLIEDLGGPTRVAELLGYDKTAGGVQRVHNWTLRGIPAAVKVQHPQVFMRHLMSSGLVVRQDARDAA